MAKSIRSKRKRKLRAKRREKLKPKVKAKLEEILGLGDKEMIVETEGCEDGDKNEEKAQEETLINQEDKTVDTDATGKISINVVKVIVTASPCEVWGQGGSRKLSPPRHRRCLVCTGVFGSGLQDSTNKTQFCLMFPKQLFYCIIRAVILRVFLSAPRMIACFLQLYNVVDISDFNLRFSINRRHRGCCNEI